MDNVKFPWQEIPPKHCLQKARGSQGVAMYALGSCEVNITGFKRRLRQHLLTLYQIRPETTFEKESNCLILSCFYQKGKPDEY